MFKSIYMRPKVAGLTIASLLLIAMPVLAAEQDVKVSIDSFTFTPSEITIVPGTTVTWVNHDDIPHTVTDQKKSFRSKPLDTDDKYSFTFTNPGEYNYFCSLHPHMTAKVIVKPGV